MPEQQQTIKKILEMRDDVLSQMAEADTRFSEVRMRVERMESDMRIGEPEPAEYAEVKGHLFPQAEREVLNCARELWRLEERIILARGRQSVEE